MAHLRMTVTGRSRAPGGLLRAGFALCLILSVWLATVAAPTPANAAGPPGATPAALVGTGGRGLMCRPEPPDYPGCSPQQVRPLLRAQFRAEYTGHARGYRYLRMGQHPRGVIFAHLSAPLNAKLARLYRAAVQRYRAHHTLRYLDPEGRVRRVAADPRYLTWAGYRAHTTAMCTDNALTWRFPVKYCWAVTKLGQAGAEINRLLNSTERVMLQCNGYAVGGFASGSFAAWRLGTGVLSGGFYGAAGVEIGCQTTNLWNWASHLW